VIPTTGRPRAFVEWRGSLRSIDQLAAYRTIDRNLITDGHAEQVRGVEISASVFQIAQVPPLLGRPLVPDDEGGGAAPVAVLGYDLWTTRFGSDAGVIGKPVRLGKETYVVVGVMPEGFGMPVSHNLWIPLRLNDAFYPRREGPATKIFGKLAPGTTISAAQAELSAIAERDAIEFAATDRLFRPIVKPYVESLWSAVGDSRMQTMVLYGANVLFLGLLALCGANIATLVFARTATRDVEISVRTALGASRARIAGQLFAEALVLSSIAAAAGLTVASFALKWVKNVADTGMGRLMFWWNDSLAPDTIVYTAVLAVIAALIIGVTPALKATGPRVQERLKQSTGATSSGLRFGGIWTGVIVTQVAMTVVFLAIVGLLGWSAYVTGGGKHDGNFPAAEYVAARFGADRADPDPGKTREQADAEYQDQIRATYPEIARQLAADPAVESITYGARLPGMNFLDMRIDVDGMPAPASGSAQSIRRALVGLNYHEAFKAPLIRGRYFSEGDLADGRHVAIVDQTFVRTVLNGQDAIGRHIRPAGDEGRQPGPWVEIVGVVGDITDPSRKKAGDSMLFEPAAAEAVYPLYVAVHARTNPSAVMSRMRLVAADVDPALRVTEMMTMDRSAIRIGSRSTSSCG
jgi:predicted permease